MNHPTARVPATPPANHATLRKPSRRGPRLTGGGGGAGSTALCSPRSESTSAAPTDCISSVIATSVHPSLRPCRFRLWPHASHRRVGTLLPVYAKRRRPLVSTV